MSANPTSNVAVGPFGPERRVRLAWQVWIDGEVRFPPLALAQGAIVAFDRTNGSRKTSVRRIDDDGQRVWETALPSSICASAVRSEGFVAVPCEDGHVCVLDVATGEMRGRPIAGGGPLLPPIAALGGRLWARFGARAGVPRRLVVASLADGSDRVEREDPLGDVIDTHFRRTNHTVVASAEHAEGHVVLVGLDARDGSALWRSRLDATRVSDLWAAGGLVDVVLGDRVMSFDARSGMPLTTRFSGMALEGSQISGETLVVLGHGDPEVAGGKQAAPVHCVSAYESANELPRGVLEGVARVVSSGSNLLAVQLSNGPFALLELPDLTPIAMPEADALADVTHVAFSWHRTWAVGHRGQSLSALDVHL